MKLEDLARDVARLPDRWADLEIEGLTADSREVRAGSLFAALPGTKWDGARFIPDAIAAGAVAVLLKGEAEEEGDGLPANWPAPADWPAPANWPDHVARIATAEPRRALALMAARFFARQPATIVAVTGTNGKTSVAAFMRQIWTQLGQSAASLGTIGLERPNGEIVPTLTTPDPVALLAMLADIAAEGIDRLALEASSHGLAQYRLDGVRITAAAFTNLSRDHLDYHETFDAYFAAKLRLFRELLPSGAPVVVDADSPESARVAEIARARGLPVLGVGREGGFLRLEQARQKGFGQRLVIAHDGRRFDIHLPLVGDFQASNALIAAGLCIATGSKPEAVLASLEGLKGVCGRLEWVAATRLGAPVFVDYAHTPDALANALAALRPFTTGRLVVVFGCGGDRDRGKRPEMGAIAAENADLVYVTDDNPRNEDPAAIRAAILSAAPQALEVEDRTKAIAEAVSGLGPGDMLLVAGKGHESGQIVGDEIIVFSDHEAIAAAIRVAEKVPDGHLAGEWGGGRGRMDEPLAGKPLWRWEEAVAAAGGRSEAGRSPEPAGIEGVSIDTRSLVPGDLFVAIRGPNRDGHAFVERAFALGAAAAMVAEDFEAPAAAGPLIRVADTLGGLEGLARAARARAGQGCRGGARIIAVTGSAGKTGTKEALGRALAASGRVHAAEKSYNNHWGVPLSLARMPAEAEFGVFEIGMNHPGEIAPLAAIVRPHVAIVTTVAPVHIGAFEDEAAVANEKGAIFTGLVPGGLALIPRDGRHYERLRLAAAASPAGGVLGFGAHEAAEIQLLSIALDAEGSDVEADICGRRMTWRLGAPGRHLALNALVVLGAVMAVGGDLSQAAGTLADVTAGKGRGARTVIADGESTVMLVDESYNANPASMRAALAALALIPRAAFPRRIAVLGDMLELGDGAGDLHRALAESVAAAGIDRVFACGEHMAGLFAVLPEGIRGAFEASAEALGPHVIRAVRPGDVVMVKGSLGSRMRPLVEALEQALRQGREQ